MIIVEIVFFLPLVYFFFLSGNWISTKGFRNVDLTFRKTFPCRSSVEIQPVRCNPLYFSGERLYPFPTIETNPELCFFFFCHAIIDFLKVARVFPHFGYRSGGSTTERAECVLLWIIILQSLFCFIYRRKSWVGICVSHGVDYIVHWDRHDKQDIWHFERWTCARFVIQTWMAPMKRHAIISRGLDVFEYVFTLPTWNGSRLDEDIALPWTAEKVTSKSSRRP